MEVEELQVDRAVFERFFEFERLIALLGLGHHRYDREEAFGSEVSRKNGGNGCWLGGELSKIWIEVGKHGPSTH